MWRGNWYIEQKPKRGEKINKMNTKGIWRKRMPSKSKWNKTQKETETQTQKEKHTEEAVEKGRWGSLKECQRCVP